MSFLKLRPAELRAPEAVVLPDNRKRLTRFFTIAQVGVLPPELNFGWGTVDTGEAPTGWTGLRLVGRRLDDDMPLPGRSDTRPVCLLIYEQISATAETRVGSDLITHGEDGGFDVVQEWVQFSTNAYSPGVVSTTTGVGFGTAYLQNEESTDDGTVRRIKRSFTTAGIIATDVQTKNNGALIVRSITSVRTVPTTPAGFTLIGEPTQNPDGLPTFTYTYAKGDGEISRDTRYSQSSDQGTTGVTVTTIRYLTPVTTSSDPTTNPGSAVKISEEKSDQDGYRVWTVAWAKGAGEIGRSIETKNGGALVLTTIRALTATSVSSQPTSDPGSATIIEQSRQDQDGYRVWSVTWAAGAGEISRNIETKNGGALVLTSIRHLTPKATGSQPTSNPGSATIVGEERSDQDGYRIWSVVWAAGAGEISRDIHYSQSSDQGTTGVTVTTIRYLTPVTTSSDPTTNPGSAVKISEEKSDQDGYRVWTVAWAKGAGEIGRSIETKNGGALVLTTIRALTAVSVGSQPTSNPGSATIASQSKQDSDGYRIWTVTWAAGSGEISRNIEYRQSIDLGATKGMTVTTIRHLTPVTTGSDPTSAPSGAVKSVEEKSDQDGYRIWTITYGKGTGVVMESLRARGDGLREQTYISLGTRVAPATGVVILDESELLAGTTRFTVTAMQAADGSAPTAATVTTERLVPFNYPGRAKAYSITAENGWMALDVFLSPPVESEVVGTVTTTYQTSDSLTIPGTRWNPIEWATIKAAWVGLSNFPGYHIEALRGYRSVDETELTYTAAIINDPPTGGTILGKTIFGGTTGVLVVTGGPENPDGNDYTLAATLEHAFTATDGTKYYRSIVITATIPAQPALPV